MSILTITAQLKRLFDSNNPTVTTNAVWSGIKIMPFANGRFVLTNGFTHIVDVTTPRMHKANPDVSLEYRAFSDIAGLTDDSTLSILYLYALAVKPLLLPEATLRSADAPKAFFLGRSYLSGNLSPDDVVWLYPDGGIESTRENYKYVPMCSRYGINEDGDLWDLVADEQVPVNSSDEEGVLIQTDSGVDIRLPIIDILALAFGKYDINTYINPAFSTVGTEHTDYGKLSTTHKVLAEEQTTFVTLTSLGERIAN